jgi:ribosomal RNA-processing protein 17
MAQPHNSSNKRKYIAVFDEDARREFITGFHKRKDERRKEAQEVAAKLAKEAKRVAKQEVNDLSGAFWLHT